MENKNKKEIVVNISEEEKIKFIEDLVFKGETTYDKSYFDGKLKVTYKSISGKEQLEVEEKMPTIKGSPAKIMHTYSMWLISYSILKINSEDFSQLSPQDRFDKISEKSNTLIDILLDGHNEFHKKLQAVTKGEVVDEVFFETTSTS
jgi:hypothetical protein